MIGIGQGAGRMARRAFLAAAVGAAAAAAAAQDAPTGDILLTVVPLPGAGEPLAIDLAALDALPQHAFSTSTPWSEGVHEYSGPALRDVLDLAGIDAPAIRAEAANDYQTVFAAPAEGADLPIIATRIDGETFARRENGPLWIMFPFDSDESMRSADHFAQSVWQLISIVAVEGL